MRLGVLGADGAKVARPTGSLTLARDSVRNNLRVVIVIWGNYSSIMRSTFLSLLALCVAVTAARAADYPILSIGSPAPDFDLPGVDGRNYSLKDFADKDILAIVFTCNHCPTAQAYEERLKKLVDDYSSKSVAVIAVNPNSPYAVRFDELGYTDVDDTLESMKIRAEERDFNFVYLDDGESEVFSKKLGPVATPHVFIFDKERKLQFQGRIDDSEDPAHVDRQDMRMAIDALLAGKLPEPQTTKVFGCSTKWDDKIEDSKRWLERVHREPVDLKAVSAEGLTALKANQGTGNVRVVNFWATWCGPCVSEFDDLMNTNLQFRQRDFEMVTVAAHSPEDHPQVLRFLKKHHASTRNLIYDREDKYEMIEAFDPEWSGALPYTVVIDPAGKVIYRETGTIDMLKIRRAIVPALNAIAPWGG